MPPEEPREGEKTRTETEWKGLMTDKQNEVRARQGIQSELAVKTTKITELEERLRTLENAPKEIKDPDATVTRAELFAEKKKTKDELVDLYKKEKAQTTAEDRAKIVNDSFNKAIKTHTKEKDGKGLSFEEVMEGTRREIAKNTKTRGLIENDTNPGEKAYQIGLQDSVIAERYKMYEKTLVEQKKIKKAGFDSTTTPGEYYSQARVKTMSKADIKLHLKEIRESQRSWNKDKIDQ
jgi:hypothetical protein